MTMKNGFDTAVLRFFANLNTPAWLDSFILLWTKESPRIFILFTAVLLLFKTTRKRASISTIAMILSPLLVERVWKPLFARPRPYDQFEWIKVIGPLPKSFSFPSGHSSVAFAFAVSLCFYSPKWAKIILLCCAALTAFTRVYISVHHVTDIIAGSVHGALCAVTAYYIVNGIETFLKKRGII